MRRLLLLIILLFLVLKGSSIEVALSHTVFYLNDPMYQGKMNPYEEVYWQINPKSIKYSTNSEKKIFGRIKTDVLITNDRGKTIKTDHYIFETTPVSNPAQLDFQNILELKRYFLTTGFITMRLSLTDLNDTNNKSVTIDTFTVADMPLSPTFGGIELVDTIIDVDIRTPFKKHGQQYIPLCANFYDNQRNTLTYYGEIYNLDKVNPQDSVLVQTVYISRKPGADQIIGYLKRDTLVAEQAVFISGNFNINTLVSGNFYLNYKLSNLKNRTLAVQSLFFQRLNTHISAAEKNKVAAKIDSGLEQVTVLNLEKTFVAHYDLPHVISILKMMRPVCDESGVYAIDGFLKKPEDTYMRYFIYNHFAAINKKDPTRAWKEFSEKVIEVNNLFNVGMTPGYETDRGIIYLRYGAPSEMFTVDHEKGSLPYELWQYNQLTETSGRVATNSVFLFYKTSETDADYRLLHSTVGGELHNEGWRSYLYISTEHNDFVSRAEQYLGKGR